MSEMAHSADYQSGFEAAKAIYGRSQRAVTYGGLTLDRIDRTVTVAGKTIALRQSHFAILDILMAGDFVPYEALANDLWPDSPPADVQGTLRVHVCMLRRLLPPGTIMNRWGQGYSLNPDAPNTRSPHA